MERKNQSLVGGHVVVHAGQNAMWKRREMVKPESVAGNLKPEHGKPSLCFTGSREILKVFEQCESIKMSLEGKESHKTETSKKAIEAKGMCPGTTFSHNTLSICRQWK